MSSQTVSTDTSDRESLARLESDLLSECGVAGTSYFIGSDTERPIHVIEAGRGEPLVLLHGGGAQAVEWATLLQHLQRHFRCLAIDRPGHGLSYRIDYRQVPDFRTDAVEFVERTLDLLGLDEAILVGNSMGGFFEIAFALAHPERVKRLVLVGAPAGIDRWVPHQVRMVGTPVIGPLLWKTVARPSERGLRDFYSKVLVADGDKLPRGNIACGAAAHRLPGADVAWLSLLRRFVTLRGVRDACYVRDELPELRVPTLFVWGDRDAFAPPASGEAASRVMPDARLEVIPGAGHLPWIDAPDQCAEAITRYLGTR